MRNKKVGFVSSKHPVFIFEFYFLCRPHESKDDEIIRRENKLEGGFNSNKYGGFSYRSFKCIFILDINRMISTTADSDL